MIKKRKLEIHFSTILLLGISVSIWAILATDYFMPVLWLTILCLFVIFTNPHEFKHFFRRFAQIGATLAVVSLLQIIFRREGKVLLSWHQIDLVFSIGLREAILLWIRFMLLFVLANILAQVSLFNFLLFINKIGISLKLSLLFLTTLKMIPFIFIEAKHALWFFRFKGVQIRKLFLRDKLLAIRKLLFPLLMRGIEYTSYSALALEMRGYGKITHASIPKSYPLKIQDYAFMGMILLVNGIGLFK